MFYKPELIVYLWLLPVICFVLLPACFSLCRSTMGFMKTSAATQKDSKNPVQEQGLENEVLA